jgi:hypothetical protein
MSDKRTEEKERLMREILNKDRTSGTTVKTGGMPRRMQSVSMSSSAASRSPSGPATG